MASNPPPRRGKHCEVDSASLPLLLTNSSVDYQTPTARSRRPISLVPARFSWLPLAARTEMAAASCEHDPLDGGSAAWAGLTGPLIDL